MLVQSTMLPLGSIATNFELLDANSNTLQTYNSLKGKNGTFIIFICNHCPYVKHIFNKLLDIFNIANQFDISCIAINSNDALQYPEDSLEAMKSICQKHNFTYLYDHLQTVAKNYQAACTPDSFIFDSNNKCVYRGRFDASTPTNNIPTTGADILYALQTLILNKDVTKIEQTPSIGCNIKWKNQV